MRAALPGYDEYTGARAYDEDHPLAHREIALVDLLDRLLGDGVVLTGDITLAIADVDLVHISLRALITSVRAGMPSPWGERGAGPFDAMHAPSPARSAALEGADR